MAIFRKKQSDPPADGGSGDGGGGGDFVPQPEKARTWFEYAKAAADSSNYDYALTCYANGIKLDPGAMSAHEAMLAAGGNYVRSGGKPAGGKELKNIGDGSDIAKFAAAEFAWMKDLENGGLALKALAAAVKADQREFGNWIASRVLLLLRKGKKLSKGPLLQAKDLFSEVGAWNEAIAAGELALSIDPSDSNLASEINDLSAQRAMDQGGYEDALREGEGGFRKVVKDLDKQRELEEAEAISGNQSVEERNIARARAEYDENPAPDVINKLAQLLRRQGTQEADDEALAIYEKGYAATNEYRFKMAAGDLKISRLKKTLQAKQASLESHPDDQTLVDEVASTRTALLQLQSEEYRERVARYPTERMRKYELGEVEFELGNFEEAMEQFQKSKDEPKLRVKAGLMLGRCFSEEGWHRDAIDEFRETLDAIDATNRDVEQDIRYELMVSLIAHAGEEQSVDVAKDALDICSAIMRKDIGFRDIRARRKEIDALIKELS